MYIYRYYSKNLDRQSKEMRRLIRVYAILFLILDWNPLFASMDLALNMCKSQDGRVHVRNRVF